jgi:hypothetical protein
MQTVFTDPGTPSFSSLQAQALGGIVLADVGTGAEIRGNLVSGNGAAQTTAPLSGIFIVAGEAITICNNRVLENGAGPAGASPDVGIRGGIVVLYAGTGAPGGIADIESILGQGGNDLANDGSSLRVINNVVRHPEGRALYVVAAGPVTVTGNSLSSDGFHGSFEDQFALGDIILVQDLGGPWERFDVTRLNTTDPAPDGEIFFTDYTTPVQAANYLFNTEPDSPRLFVGVGGQVSFQNNQVTFDWFVQNQPPEGVPLAIFPVALMTLDHLSVVGNQFAFRVQNLQVAPAPPDPTGAVTEPVLAHVYAAGATVDVTGNRMSETFKLVFSSIWSLGELLNFTSYNQTTHFNISEVSKGTAMTAGNQVVFSRKTFPLTNTDTAMHMFFELLFRSSVFFSPPIPRPPHSPGAPP